jgi:hypothetical protein
MDKEIIIEYLSLITRALHNIVDLGQSLTENKKDLPEEDFYTQIYKIQKAGRILTELQLFFTTSDIINEMNSEQKAAYEKVLETVIQWKKTHPND